MKFCFKMEIKWKIKINYYDNIKLLCFVLWLYESKFQIAFGYLNSSLFNNFFILHYSYDNLY